jgi:Kef-type K+ transport system membrane component KefB
MTLIVGLFVMLITAHLLGRLAEQLQQPALAGQMLAGIVLGPSVLGWVHAAPMFSAVADLSVFFVVATAGLEMRMQHVLDIFRGRGAFALLLGFVIPAAAAGVFAYWKGLGLLPGAVTTLCLSVTALPVALRILSSFGLLETQIARVAIASALLSDVIVLMLLGITLSLAGPQPTNAWLPVVAIAVAKLGALIALVGICHFICIRLSTIGFAENKRCASKGTAAAADAPLILTLLFILGLGTASDLLGFHFAIGAFLAALMVTRDLISDVRFEKLERTCELMTASLFAPLFLTYQGIQFEIGALNDIGLVTGLLLVGIVAKIVAGYAAASWMQLNHREATSVGVIMNARGVVGMVVASIAYRAGLIDQALFSALLLVGIVTTAITPLLLKPMLKSTH